MAVANAACPNCGGEALVTVPSADHSVTAVSGKRAGGRKNWDTEASCKQCGDRFWARYSR
jgi:5-methylcytosine-specific restriction endonuclease McrA